jgi:hypothetical protein
MGDLIPCVVFAFNRPDQLGRVLEALRPQKIDALIVYVDGPRNNRDVELVGRCHAIAGSVDWVDKELHFREQNRGLPGLAENITEVLVGHPWAVFIEDDCLPMPGFYSFMRRALVHYESNQKVFSVGGYQPIPQEFFKDYPFSVVSCARFMCWGWATWGDRWSSIAAYRFGFADLFNGLNNVPDIAGCDIVHTARAVARGESNTWDVQVAIATLWLGKVHLLPVRGLVRNIGLHGGGTHDGSYDAYLHNQNVSEELSENIVWLENVELNKKYTERVKRFVDECNRPLKRTLWYRVKTIIRELVFV